MQEEIIQGTKQIRHHHKRNKKIREKQALRSKPYHDITGQTFGRLEVLRMARTEQSKRGEFMAICKCHACGREDYEARPYWVKKGSHSGTCGCDKTYFERNRGESSSYYKGYKGIGSHYFSNAKRRSEKLGLQFNLDMEFLWDLYEKQDRKCALSGVPIFFMKNRRDSGTGNISLDRIDSNNGYIKGNIQWVHKDINLMKMYLDESVFLDFCKKICINKKLIEAIWGE